MLDAGSRSLVPSGSRKGALGFPLHLSQFKAYLCFIYSESDHVDSCSRGKLGEEKNKRPKNKKVFLKTTHNNFL